MNSLNKSIFITVRMASTRLSNKCLLYVDSKNKAIEFLIKRMKKVESTKKIILCTTMEPEDDILEQIADIHRIDCFRGPNQDKLLRWIFAAEHYPTDFFITADGDDLFCDPDMIDLAFKQYDTKKHSFIKSSLLPCGSFSWGIETKALKRVYNKYKSVGIEDTEMGFKWFDDVHELENIPKKLRQPNLRMTLDYPEDYEFFKQVISAMGNVALEHYINFLKVNPKIVKLNAFRQIDYLQNQDKKG